MIMSNEKQDINSDFNRIKHAPKDKDHTHICREASDRIVCFLSSKKNKTKNHI